MSSAKSLEADWSRTMSSRLVSDSSLTGLNLSHSQGSGLMVRMLPEHPDWGELDKVPVDPDDDPVENLSMVAETNILTFLSHFECRFTF